MKFYKFSEIPVRSDDQVFKSSPIGSGISFVVISAIVIAALLLGIHGGEQYGINLPRVLFYILAAFAGLFDLFAFQSFQASLKPTNWLLRCNNNGVIIHFRSFLNWRFPSECVQAVGFDYSEIAWARTVKERRISPSMGYQNNRIAQTQQLTFLDLCLVNADTTALEEHLQQERNLRPDGITISLDYPVQVLSGGIVELRWSGGISPSARKAIQCLRQHITIAGAYSRIADLTHQKNLQPGEEDTKILKLATTGDEMGAVTLTRQIYGCSLSEARSFVEKLLTGGRGEVNQDKR
ncbi:MAG TPA: hypothetical protein VIK53_09480 [Verrucomicrobiae bacterium]